MNPLWPHHSEVVELASSLLLLHNSAPALTTSGLTRQFSEKGFFRLTPETDVSSCGWNTVELKWSSFSLALLPVCVISDIRCIVIHLSDTRVWHKLQSCIVSATRWTWRCTSRDWFFFFFSSLSQKQDKSCCCLWSRIYRLRWCQGGFFLQSRYSCLPNCRWSHSYKLYPTNRAEGLN